MQLLVGHHRAHSPILAKAREIIQSGRLGKIVAVMGSALFYKPDDYFESATWRREAGGGPLLILAGRAPLTHSIRHSGSSLGPLFRQVNFKAPNNNLLLHLRIERLTHCADGTPIDYEYLYFRGDAFQYRMRIDREKKRRNARKAR